MDRKVFEQFQAERARRFDEAAQKLLAQNDVEAAKKYLDWAETSAKLLAAPQQAARRRWTLFVLAVCVLAVGLAWTLRISFTHLALDVTTGNVVLTLRNKWTWDQQFNVERVFVNNLNTLAAPGLNLSVRSETGDASIDLQGTGIQLNELTIASGAEIEFKVLHNELQWFIKKASLTGTLQVQDAEMTIKTGDQIETKTLTAKTPPEKIRFATAPMVAAPLELRFVTRDKWRLRDFRTQALDFTEEHPLGAGQFESVLRSGNIMLRETGFTQDLREADYLVLKHPRSDRLEFSLPDKADNGVNVLFEGTAASIRTGSQDFQQDITPTYFEYLARQKWIMMFWSAVAFLSGLIWKIRDTFLG